MVIRTQFEMCDQVQNTCKSLDVFAQGNIFQLDDAVQVFDCHPVVPVPEIQTSYFIIKDHDPVVVQTVLMIGDKLLHFRNDLNSFGKSSAQIVIIISYDCAASGETE